MKIHQAKFAVLFLFVGLLHQGNTSSIGNGLSDLELADDPASQVETFANPPPNRIRADDHSSETDEQNRITSLTVRLTKVAEGKGTGDGLVPELPGGIESIGGVKGVDTISFILGPKLGGKGTRDNIFAQNRKVNRGIWRTNEDKIVNLVDETGSALVIFFLEYETNSTSLRPSRVAISVLRDFKDDVNFLVLNPTILP